MSHTDRKQIRVMLDDFKAYGVRHLLQQDSFEELMSLIDYSPNVSIVTLVGPTGVGKTRLQEAVFDEVMRAHAGEMTTDPNHMPVIQTLARAAGHRQFDWRLLYSLALEELGDPFFSARKAKASSGEGISRFKLTGESRSAAELRMHLEHEFRIRRVRLWMIDEAQHIVFGGRSGQPGDQFDVLKSIAQSTGAKLLLAGPGIMEIQMGTSGQLARRSTSVYYSRYNTNDPVHLKVFASVANSLIKQMRIDGAPIVTDLLTLLYGGSAGCIGILKDWLARAYARTLLCRDDSGKAYLTIDVLRKTRLKAEKMMTIMEDIRRHEELCAEAESDELFERIVLGKELPDGSASASGNRKPQLTARSRVGIRSPKRDSLHPNGRHEQGGLL